jgi:putative transposase
MAGRSRAHPAHGRALSAAAIKELELAPAGARYTVGVRPRAWRNPNGSTTPRIDRALTDARSPPTTTPAYGPESNGLAEAFVETFKRDCVHGVELRDTETVLSHLGGWSADYNTQAPHAALGFRSPADYRAEQVTVSSPCAQ